ncbi:MAG: SH3 domain-containing protein [Thermoplasmata archaeon]
MKYINSVTIVVIISFFLLNNIPIANHNQVLVAQPNYNNISKIIKVTAQTLNVRDGPGTNYSIAGQVSYGSEFYAYKEANGTSIYGNDIWYRIYWKGTSGWVSSYYTTPLLPSPYIQIAVEVNAPTVQVITTPNASSSIIGQVYQNQIYVLATYKTYQGNNNTQWVQIFFNNATLGYTGFIEREYVYKVTMQSTSILNTKLYNNYTDISLKKIVMPYIYPDYPQYVEDLANYSNIISGLQYEQYYLTSSLTLGDFGDGGVGYNASLYNIPKWPMIVNDYNVSRTSAFLNSTNVQSAFISNAVSLAVSNNYAGYSIDFEGTTGYTLEDSMHYISFLNDFANQLHIYGKKLAVAPQPAYNGIPNSYLDYYIYNPYTRINVDYIMPQCYEGYFSYGSYSFIDAVSSMLNAVGKYISPDQIVILLMTTNPNTNAYFTYHQMNERINYLESVGINGIGIWSMDEAGGFPSSQELWGQLADFEYSPSAWNVYNISYAPGSSSIFSNVINNVVGIQLLGQANQNVIINGSSKVTYYSDSQINNIKFYYTAYLPSGTHIEVSAMNRSGYLELNYTLSKSGEYNLSMPLNVFGISFDFYTTSNLSLTLSFNNPYIAYIKDIQYNMSWNVSYNNSINIMPVISNNSISAGFNGNLGYIGANGFISISKEYNHHFSSISMVLYNNEPLPLLNISIIATSVNGSKYAYYFINGFLQYGEKKSMVYYLPSLSNKITFNICFSNQSNVANSSWNVDILNISTNVTNTLYKVIFQETGLANNTTWQVNLSGLEKSSNTGIIVFYEPNGTYSYTIANISGYYAEPYKGSFNVTGLSNQIWWVNLSNGQSFESINNTIKFYEPNGSYRYSIGTIKGYYANKTTGYVNISGKEVVIHVIFNPINKISNSTTSNIGNINSMEYIGIISIIIVISSLIAYLIIKRKNRNINTKK